MTYGGWQPHFRAEIALFGNNRSPVVPHHFSDFHNIPTSPHLNIFGILSNKKTVVRARDLYRSGIHPEMLSRALQRAGLLSRSYPLEFSPGGSTLFDLDMCASPTVFFPLNPLWARRLADLTLL